MPLVVPLITLFLIFLLAQIIKYNRLWKSFRLFPYLNEKQSYLLGHYGMLNDPSCHLCFEKYADQLGPFYCIRLFVMPFVIISDAEMIHFILKSRPILFRRPRLIENVFRELGLHGLFSAEGSVWKSWRTIMAPAFTAPKMKDHYQCILHEAAKDLYLDLLDRVQHQSLVDHSNNDHQPFQSPIQVFPDVKRTTMRIVTQVAFCWGHEELISPDLLNDLHMFFEVIPERMNSILPIHKFLIFGKHRKFSRVLGQLNQVVRLITTRYNEKLESATTDPGNGTKTFLEMILNASSSAKLSMDEVRSNIIQFLIAGYDTTATSMAWMLHYLACYPEFQKRFHDEVDHLLLASEGKYENINYNMAQFTQDFIREVMRRSPIAPYLYAENVDDVILPDKRVLPRNTMLILLTRQVGLNERLFKDPFTFCPDRWSEARSTDPNLYASMCNACLGFGAGPRICPGRHLAIMEMTVLLIVCFSRFHISFAKKPPGHDVVTEVCHFTVAPSSLDLVFSPRQSNLTR